MAKAIDIAKDLFNLAKGKGLEKPRAGSESVGVRDNDAGSPGQSPGSFNIGSFTAAMQQSNGFARANRFLVTIDTPPGPWVKSDTVQQLQFFCDNVNMPGASLIPIDHKRNSIGPFDRRPSAIIPSEISASFMLDAQGRNLDFFQAWTTNIVNMGQGGKAVDNVVNGATGAAFGEIAYSKDYVTTMRIETFDMNANKINTLTAYECWPSQLGDVTLGWGQNDEIARVTVNFQLRNWESEMHNLPEGQDPSVFANRALTPMEQLLRIGQTATALQSSIKTPNNVGDAINILSNAQNFGRAIGGRG